MPAGSKKFDMLVYKACRLIPEGCVVTYKDIAIAIGKPYASRAVGQALKRNPFAPYIPCHRVIRSDGSIGGYSGGVRKKIRILKSEGVI